MQHLNLNWLRTFEAVVRCGGITAATRELGLTQTAISLQVKALETKLGHDLFIRKAKSLELTEVAKAYLPSVQNALESLSMSTNGLFGPDLKSTIVIRSSMAMILWLAPRLGEFRDLHPGVKVKLVTAIWNSSANTQNADIDIVMAPNNRTQTNHEKLSDERLVPICSNHLNAQHLSAVELQSQSPIHVLGFDDHWAKYLRHHNLRYDIRSTHFMVDTTVAACELVAANQGAAVIIERFAKSAIAMGQDIRIAGEPVPLDQSHYIAENNPAAEIRPAVHAFREWLQSIFNKESEK
ncbi:MAG: LysR family transcriptional regulator [Pseudomonadota bacterium]